MKNKICRLILGITVMIASAAYAADGDTVNILPQQSDIIGAGGPDTSDILPKRSDIAPRPSIIQAADDAGGGADVPPQRAEAGAAVDADDGFVKPYPSDADPAERPLRLPGATGAAGAAARDPAMGLAAGDGKDTLPPLRGRYWGLGAGVTLGGAPLFTMWNRALPDSLSRLGLPQDFGRDTEPGAPDTLPLRYGIFEAPDEFNFFVPFNLSLYIIKEKYAVSAVASFFYNTKQFQSTVYRHLDEDRSVNLYNTMRFYSVTFEASYHLAVPPEYFSISGSQETWVSLTVGASPFQYLSRSGDVTLGTDAGDARLRAVADSAQNIFSDFAANGAALSWRLGFTTLRTTQKGNGIMFGLYYGGAYSGWFWREGNRVMNSDVDRLNEDEKVKPLGFVSNRLEINVTFLMTSKKNAGLKTQNSESTPQPAGTEPADMKLADTEPADKEPSDIEPADTESTDTEPADTQPAAPQPEGGETE